MQDGATCRVGVGVGIEVFGSFKEFAASGTTGRQDNNDFRQGMGSAYVVSICYAIFYWTG